MKKGTKEAPRKMRDLMPKRFLPILVERTGSNRSNISTTITDEKVTAEIWGAIVKLAAEEHPEEAAARDQYARKIQAAREAERQAKKEAKRAAKEQQKQEQEQG